MSDTILKPAPVERPIRRRTRRDPKPRFLPDRKNQFDLVAGCPEALLPRRHLARQVWAILLLVDLSSIEAGYSSLGRRGIHPRNLLAVWVYASILGLHHSTKVAAALKTDSAFRWLCGGHKVCSSKLRAFRQEHGALFQAALDRTVQIAQEKGLLKLDEVAIDSVRIRAHGSLKAVRTLKRSQKRLEELAGVDVHALSEEERAKHESKVFKHKSAVEFCDQQKSANVVLTNPLASLMKFPNGASEPGHRFTVTAAGVKERMVVSVLVDAAPTDYGKLEPALEETRRVLARIGLDEDVRIEGAADAGYCSHQDLLFEEKVRSHANIVIDVPDEQNRGPKGFFGREHFSIQGTGTALCPAKKPMKGPSRHSDGRTMWTGVGCKDCLLQPECTPNGRHRTLTVNADLERLREGMRARLASAEGKKRYNKRIATVEPVFSFLEATMGYRRASSRHSQTVVSEALLKLLAHNVSRLLASGRLFCVRVLIIPATEGQAP